MASARYRGRMIVNDTDYTGSFVDPNPEGVATDDLNTVAINGHIFNVVGSGGGGAGDITNYYGVFIDTQNVILPKTRYVDGDSYTATQDCYGFICYQLGSGKTQITLDGMDLVNISGVSNIYSYIVVNLAKGQTINFISTFSGSFYLTVYGVKSGSEASYFQPIIYSTEEREIGVWTDGKPLYQKTFDCGALLNAQTKEISFTEDMETATIIDAFAMSTSEGYVISLPDVVPNYVAGSVRTYVSKTAKKIYIYSQADMRTYEKSYVTIQYTKTTDVAGSAQYTTLGVPAVHYDDNEKIVGTYFGETLYERTFNIGSISSANDGYVIGDKAALKIKNCVELYGKCTYETNGEKQTISLPNYSSSTYYIRIYYESDIGVVLGIPSLNGKTGIWFEYSNDAFQYYNNDIYITIRYTKTTD